MALALKELQKGLPDHRRSPFLLFTRHLCSRCPKIPICECGGCCARAQKWSRRLGFIESSKVTQSDSSATTSSQIIHPLPSGTRCPDRSVLRESPAQIAYFDWLFSALENSIRRKSGRIVVLLGREVRFGRDGIWIACKRQAGSRKERLRTKTMNGCPNG